MQYMLLVYNAPVEPERSEEEWQGIAEPYLAYTQLLRERGAFVDGAPLAGASTATTIRQRDGRRLVTDGPFAETKEWLGGFYIIECATLDEAIALAAECPSALDGSVEIRPLVDMG